MPRHYPWDLWLDGEAHRIEQGTDFSVPVPAMRAILRNAAEPRGLAVISWRRPLNGPVLWFQAWDAELFS